MTLQVEAGLKNDGDCAEAITKLFERGRQLGFSRAEMDAAFKGSSFEVRTSAAVTFACALKRGETAVIAAARNVAARAGLTD